LRFRANASLSGKPLAMLLSQHLCRAQLPIFGARLPLTLGVIPEVRDHLMGPVAPHDLRRTCAKPRQAIAFTSHRGETEDVPET
jgi:hypothetical protein